MKRIAGRLALLFLPLALVQAQTPAAVSVINYSGYNPSAPLAPGSIASAYGAFGNVTTTTWNGQGTMPKTLGNVTVRVNNIDCPLYFVSSGQINFNIPNSVLAGKQTVEVAVSGSVVASGSVNIYEFFPALAVGTGPTKQGQIINVDGGAVNGASAPAARGAFVALFATGCGVTNPPSLDGVPASAATPAVAKVEAWVSVDSAEVAYAGAQSQYPGVCQVNIRIPNKPYIAGAVPLFITVNGVASNPVSVVVQQ